MAASLYCPDCNAENEPESRVCGACGHAFKGDPTTLIGPHMTAPTHAAPVPVPPAETQASGLLAADSILQGRYRITQLLGQGGMGAVYLASDARFSARTCVIKEMLDHFNDPEQRAQATESFHREADLLSSFKHPGIPEVYDRFTEANRHYLVMEYINGVDLEQRLLDNGGPFSEKEVIEWSIQCCDVLSYLHHQKPPVIYRDMKPANVITTHWGKVYLVDFGIARFFNPVSRGTMIGTQGYAPPEQYRGQVDPRSDLYALGATIHYLLTGRDPQNEPPFSFPPVTSLNPEVSPEMEMLVLRALDPEADNRFSSADEMLGQLMAIGGDASDVVRDCPHCGFRSTVTRQFCPSCKQYISKKAHVLKPQQGSGAIPTDAAGLHQTKLATGRTSALQQGNRSATATVLALPTGRVEFDLRRVPPAAWGAALAALLVLGGLSAWGLAGGTASSAGISAGSTLLQSVTPAAREGAGAHERGAWPEAADAFRRAIEEHPEDPEPRIYWQNTLLRLSNVEATTLAVSGTFVGPERHRALEMLRGAALAQQAANARGRSPHIAMVLVGDDGTAPSALRVAQQIAANGKVVGLVATEGGSLDASVLNLHTIAGLPLVAAGRVTTSGLESHPGPTRLALGGQQLAEAMADHLAALGVRRPIVLERSEGAAEGDLSGIFSQLADQRGWECDTLPPASSARLLEKVRAHRADAIVVGEQLEVALAAAEAVRREGLTIPVIGGPGLHQPERLTRAADRAEGLLVVSQLARAPGQPGEDGFAGRYREAFRAEPGEDAALAYDSVRLMVQALDLAGARRDGLASALQKLARQGYEGVAGRVTLSDSGEVHRTVTVGRVHAGRLVPVRQVAL
ncbi:MAG: protein kinase [Candidatus Sericytochromatia bacterium]|nr:protein kinase [Candidatus Sericytochromatia bacterium]